MQARFLFNAFLYLFNPWSKDKTIDTSNKILLCVSSSVRIPCFFLTDQPLWIKCIKRILTQIKKYKIKNNKILI